MAAGMGRADELDLRLDAGGDDATEAAVAQLEAAHGSDLDRLTNTHLSLVARWDGVRPSGRRRNASEAEPGPVHWAEQGDGMVAPVDEGAASTLVAVPEDATYRVNLRLQLGIKPCPVTLSLTPQAAAPAAAGSTNPPVYADSGVPQENVYGRSGFLPSLIGKEQEKRLPIRFERETQLIAMSSGDTVVWEHWDVALKKGVYRAALASADKRTRVSALLLSRSRDFRPSFGLAGPDRTLGRIYMRFRAAPAERKAGATFAVTAALGYHWRGRKPEGSTEDAWGWPIGSVAASPVGEWSAFVEATDAIEPGPGPWSTCNLGVRGVDRGDLDVQIAWHPSPAGVAFSSRTAIGGGQAMLRVPHGDWSVRPQAGVPAWGVWGPDFVARIMTQESVIERYFRWAKEAAEKLSIPAGHPVPRHLRLITSCNVNAANRERAAEMLAQLGLNWIEGAPESVTRKYGLCDDRSAYNTADPGAVAHRMGEADRARVTKVKIGDEIGTYTDPSAVNGDAGKMDAFRAYLTEQARLVGMEPTAFLGVENVDDIACIGELPANPGRYERRLFYHSQRFCHLTTCDYYASVTRGFEKLFPNVHVYNNYSPHPLFLTGTTMNGSDWFVLPRNGAQTLGWAEDWATGGSWGLGTRYQCTSFYAALVDCAVRARGYPSGFYVGVNCGGGAVKIFSCVGQGLTWLLLYSWGPIDGLAEGSNAWSEHQDQYYQVLCAAHALGPADEIIALGKREPRRTAILYNRSHEILNGGLGRMNHDWMWTYIALRASQIPVDVIIEEDLNAEDLKRYDCLWLGGLNLERRHVAAVRQWVEAGGVVIGSAGAAMRDVYNDPLPEAAELFGARSRAVRPSETGSVARVQIAASDVFPSASFAPGGLRFVIEPAGAAPAATYGGGLCAATARAAGKGQAILLGFQPGFAYRDSGQATGEVRQVIAAPVLKRIGRPRVEFDYPASEATLFEHESGIAVTLADFGGASPEGGSKLSVQAGRPVKEVTSALHGPLEWKQTGDRIEVVVPRLAPVDTVILK